jgi:hypothetical protein
MSLHAELTSEAIERLRIQRRNSTISSLVIAVLTIVLIGLALGFVFLNPLIKESPTIVTYQSNLNEETQLEDRKVQTNFERKPSSPTSSMAKVITASTTSNVAIPVTDVDVPAPSLDFGDGDDFGSGWGDGAGEGGGFASIPPVMKKRCSKADRLQRLQETGGTPECEEAVLKALRWMKTTQSADGSWNGGIKNHAAMTGLALLAYLGHCETPLSEEFGDTVLKAITYLVNLGMKQKGKLASAMGEGHWPYEHAIATYALAESTTFCKQLNIPVPNLEEVTQMAGQFIIDNQHRKTGAWDYSYDVRGDRGGDTSVTAWHVQALKACEHTGLKFRNMNSTKSKAADYIEAAQNANGGFGYRSKNEKRPYLTMTGGCVLSLQMMGRDSSAMVRRGVEYISENTRFNYTGKESDLYGHYYEAQAMMNRGGSDWKKYNAIFRDQLLKNQAANGTWPKPNNGNAKTQRAVAGASQMNNNPHYRTCLNTLMLEVYYRFLPGTTSKSE